MQQKLMSSHDKPIARRMKPSPANSCSTGGPPARNFPAKKNGHPGGVAGPMAYAVARQKIDKSSACPAGRRSAADNGHMSPLIRQNKANKIAAKMKMVIPRVGGHAELRSPAYRVLSLSARRLLDRMEIELADHGGTDNGKLPVTYDDFERYGIHRHAVGPAIRELVALGFVEITEVGRAGNAEWRKPNVFRLTYR